MRNVQLLKWIAFCLTLLFIRLLKTGESSFIFLGWNLFLAVLPCVFLSVMEKVKMQWQKNLLLIVCILFLPNAPYLLTDLFHLRRNNGAPIWFDLVLISGFAVLGLWLFSMAMSRLLKSLSTLVKNAKYFFVIKTLLFLSNGYGIYLGRYGRFNSWDVVSQPNDLISGIYDSVVNLSRFISTLEITLTFAIFLYLIFGIYESFNQNVGHKTQQFPH